MQEPGDLRHWFHAMAQDLPTNQSRLAPLRDTHQPIDLV